jgi:peroxiredoxin
MDSVVLAARLLLCAVFVVAAIGKLVDLEGSRRSLVGFGVPQPLANVFGTALPFAELAVAILLIPRPTALWGAVGALVLLLAFCAGIGNALRQGEAPPCNCFGAIHSAPASGWTLARNAVLAAVAVIGVAWGPGPAIDSWVSARTAAELVAICIAIPALFLLVVAVPMWLENRRLKAQLAEADERISHIPHGLRLGAPAPEFSVPDGRGGRTTLSDLLARGKPVAIIFTVAGCGPCEPMIPYLRRLQSIAADRITIALVGISTVERYDRVREAHPEGIQLREAIVEDPELKRELDELVAIGEAYLMGHSPGAVIVTPAGTIGSATVDGRRAIEALLRITLAQATLPPPALSAPSGASAA